MQIDTPRRAPALTAPPSRMLLSATERLVEPHNRMASTTEFLEDELRRNFKLRRELGAEIRLELLTSDTAEKRDTNSLGTLTRLVGAAWITAGLIALALAAFIIAIRVA